MDSFSFDPSVWKSVVYVLAITVLGFVTGNLVFRPPFPSGAPKLVEAWPVLGAIRFFTSRDAFLKESAKTPSGNFSFYVGKYRVIGLSREIGRRLFFESKDLELDTAYAVLFNATPQVKDNSPGEKTSDRVKRNLSRLMKKESISQVMPLLLSDTRGAMEILSSREKRVLDPFVDIYRLVYQLTMRTVGCDEIAEDPKQVARTLTVFERIEGSSYPASLAAGVIFPWLPTIRKFQMMWGGLEFYMTVNKVVEARQKSGGHRKDAVQMLMDQGVVDTAEIVQFIITALFAGLINSGINAAWLLTFLAEDRYWYGEFQKEVDAVVAKHRDSAAESPVDVLSKLDMDEFEVFFPLIDHGLKETIRHTMTGCAFRYNSTSKDLKIGDSGDVVPPDHFVVYAMDEVHFDPNVYAQPERWDPGRFLPDRAEDKKTSHGYLGWGSGRHPCLGMKFAKLEMALIIAFFIASFEFKRCDKNGDPISTPLPEISRRTASASKPKNPVYISYEERK